MKHTDLIMALIAIGATFALAVRFIAIANGAA